MPTYAQLEMFGTIAPIELPTLGTYATFRRGGITVLASGPIPLPAVEGTEIIGQMWSSEFGRNIPIWGNSDDEYVCHGGHVASYDDGRCSNCDCCSDCCECFYCEACSEPVSDLVACGTCNDCCTCTVCYRCETHCGNGDGNENYSCGDCEYCSDCCECLRCDYCGESVEAVCEEHYQCSYCCECDSTTEEALSVAADVADVARYVPGILSTLTRYTFGVELEHTGNSTNSAARALESVGLFDWDSKGEHCGTECVSPILRGDDGFDQLRAACEALSAIGGRVNGNCGTHIHLGADGMEPSDIARVVRFYNRNYSIIDQLHAPSRRGHHTYTNPNTEYEMMAIDTAVTNGEDHYGVSRAVNDRYRAVNVHALRAHGTIEFRQHAGSLDHEKLGAWIRFLFALCDCARFSKARETFGDVPSMLEHLTGFGLDSSDVAYLANRAIELAS